MKTRLLALMLLSLTLSCNKENPQPGGGPDTSQVEMNNAQPSLHSMTAALGRMPKHIADSLIALKIKNVHEELGILFFYPKNAELPIHIHFLHPDDRAYVVTVAHFTDSLVASKAQRYYGNDGDKEVP